MTDIISPAEFRRLCRENRFDGHTSGRLAGYAQANVLVLPREMAEHFADLCARNPVACPLLARTMPGCPHEVDDKRVVDDKEFDLRRDVPKYRVYKHGELVIETCSVEDYWDLEQHVGFLIGCSFSFEKALVDAGLAPRNVVQKRNVSMYVTSKQLDAAGVFVKCPYVVSMRPYKVADLDRVRTITRRFRKTHGEPIDWGYDAVERLGIRDLSAPEFGSVCEIAQDEVPVFWACGVTTQVAAQLAGKDVDEYLFSHVPGHMLILDLKDSDITNL